MNETTETTTTGGALGTVRRNREHDGVEISFPSKPSSGVLDALKREGFRWSRFSKVWYKKFSAASWKAACDIVGITAAQSPAAEPETPDRFDMQVEDNMAAACGL